MPDPRQFLPILSPDRLAMMQPQASGPSGIASFLSSPGVGQGLMAAGLRLLASDKRRETFGQALYDAVPQGIGAYEHAKQKAEWGTLLNETDMPETQKAVLRMIGPDRGALVLAQGMMQPEPGPTALGANERLVDPTGRVIVDALPQPTDAERPVVLGEGSDLVDPTTGAVIASNEAAEQGPEFSEVAALRNRFEQNVAPYEDAAQAYRKMEASATGDPTPAKDIALIFNYMKTIDPASSVREGEFATAQNAGSAWAQVGNMYNRVLTGTRLNPTQRAEFLNSAKEQLASLLPQYQGVADQYRSIAESNRFDPAQIIRNPFTGLNLAQTEPAAGGMSDDEIYNRVRGRP